jgi:hypothetical protein
MHYFLNLFFNSCHLFIFIIVLYRNVALNLISNIFLMENYSIDFNGFSIIYKNIHS